MNVPKNPLLDCWILSRPERTDLCNSFVRRRILSTVAFASCVARSRRYGGAESTTALSTLSITRMTAASRVFSGLPRNISTYRRAMRLVNGRASSALRLWWWTPLRRRAATRVSI